MEVAQESWYKAFMVHLLKYMLPGGLHVGVKNALVIYL